MDIAHNLILVLTLLTGDGQGPPQRYAFENNPLPSLEACEEMAESVKDHIPLFMLMGGMQQGRDYTLESVCEVAGIPA